MAAAPQAQEQENAPPAQDGDDRIVLRGQFQIVPHQPLPQYDSPGRPAYNVVDLHGSSGPLFALICDTPHCPRIDNIPTFMRMPKIPVVVPLQAGVVYWPPANAKRAVLIFEQPWGGRLVDDPNGTIERWREDRVIDTLLKPVASALREFNDRYVTHRAIRPDNVFTSGAKGVEVILGECASTQPGYHQPIYMEPIDSAMAHPSGRGDGTPADDIYSLGILVTFLLTGGNPVGEMTDEEVVEAKISRGSYAVMTQKIRASLQIIEVLRGMLCDDPLERWTIDDLEAWISGRHLSPKQAILPRKAQRAYMFGENGYFTAQTLSFALGRDWEAALPLARDGSIERWVRRSLSNEALADNLIEAMESAKTDSVDSSLDDVLLSMVLMALDPTAPIRFRDFSARPDGIGKAYAIDNADEDKRKIYLEIVGSRLVGFWAHVQLKPRPDLPHIKRDVDAARRLLQRAKLAFGPERVLYMTNPGWACQSPLLVADYVSEASEILPALNAVVERNPQIDSLIDNHIVAFCAVTHRRMPEAIIYELAKQGDEKARAVAVMQLMGEIQRVYGPDSLPALAAWCAERATLVVATYHNRQVREQLEVAVKKATKQGSISGVLDTVDNMKARKKDNHDFQFARHKFAFHSQQIEWIRVGGLRDSKFVRRVSRPIASIITAACAGIAILIMVVAHVT